MKRRYRYKEIQLSQLRSFCLAATSGSFTAAAKAAALSLSTVWEQIRALEARLGVTLLRRRGRAVEVTVEGRLLLDIVRPHVEGLDSLEELFAIRCSQPPQEVKLATSPYVLHHHLPSVMKTFAAAYPSVHVTVQFPEPFAVASLVERGEVNFAVHSYDREERPRAALEYEELAADPLQLLVPARHILAKKRHVTLADVVGCPVVLVGGETFTHRLIHRILQRHGLEDRLRVVMEVPFPDAIPSYVTQEVGVALIHLPLRWSFGKGVRRLFFEPALEPLPFAFIIRKHPFPVPLVQTFRRLARELLVPNWRS